MTDYSAPVPSKRRKGGQPGNQNAFKHGRYSPRVKAERLAAWKARQAAEREKSEAWCRSCPPVGYDAIIERLEAALRERLE